MIFTEIGLESSWRLVACEFDPSFSVLEGPEDTGQMHLGYRKVKFTGHRVSERVAIFSVKVGYGALIITT